MINFKVKSSSSNHEQRSDVTITHTQTQIHTHSTRAVTHRERPAVPHSLKSSVPFTRLAAFTETINPTANATDGLETSSMRKQRWRSGASGQSSTTLWFLLFCFCVKEEKKATAVVKNFFFFFCCISLEDTNNTGGGWVEMVQQIIKSSCNI